MENPNDPNEYAHPPGYVCPDGPDGECTGCGARDCPHGEPLHYHHDGCPACYTAQMEAARRLDDVGTANRRKEEEDRMDALETEVFSLNLGARISDVGATLAEHGAREGTQSEYPAASRDDWSPPDAAAVQALAAQYRGGTLPLNDFVFALSGVEWGVCEWGSCQYATAQAMFYALRALRGAGLEDPLAVMGWGSSSDILPAPMPLADALTRISAGLVEEIQRHAAEDGEAPEEAVLAAARALVGAASLDPAFEVMRECSWDLWTAAAHTAQLVFGTNFADIEGRVDASPGRGAALNILAQSDNYTTALRCYALWAVGYITHADEAFGGFDT